jgi:hypothetical protein
MNYETDHVKDVMDKIAKVIQDLSSDEEPQPALKLMRVSFDPTKISWKQYNKTVSQNTFQRTTLVRMQQYSVKKQEHLRKAAETEARKYSEDHRHRPHIDSKSAAMVSGKKPIQDRTEEIMQMRTDKIKEKRQKKAEAKDQLEQSFSFKPTLKESKAFQSPSSVIERNEKWNEIKLKANEGQETRKGDGPGHFQA